MLNFKYRIRQWLGLNHIEKMLDSHEKALIKLKPTISKHEDQHKVCCEICGGIFASWAIKKGPSTIRQVAAQYHLGFYFVEGIVEPIGPAREEIVTHYYCRAHFPREELKEEKEKKEGGIVL